MGVKHNKAIMTLRDVQEFDATVEAYLVSDDIGTVIRNGRTIYYANLRPLHLGLTIEGNTRAEVAIRLAKHAHR